MYTDAGHIIGSAAVHLIVKENNKNNIAFINYLIFYVILNMQIYNKNQKLPSLYINCSVNVSGDSRS